MSFDPSAAPSTSNCPFCKIGAAYPPTNPASDARPFEPETAKELCPQAFVVLRTELCMAFLDIMPLSPGHLLVCSRAHHEKITDVSDNEAAELGRWLRVLSGVLARVTGVEDWNIVQNNGAAAAQVVPHVHYHIIPRPALTATQRNRSFTMFGRGQRSELDDDEATELVGKLRKELAKQLQFASEQKSGKARL